jgi:hypothetical protein
VFGILLGLGDTDREDVALLSSGMDGEDAFSFGIL